MAIRTDPDSVIKQLGRNYDGKTPLDGFMKSANVLTNNVNTQAAKKGLVLDSDTLLQVETLLACHFYQRHDPGFQSKNTGRSAAAFQGQTGMMIKSTTYGQDAIAMDWTGILGSFDVRGKVTFKWMGKPASAQIPYDQRN